MLTTTTTHVREAVRRRMTSVLEALSGQGITRADVHAEFLKLHSGDRDAAQAAWTRLRRMENPRAGDLMLYARVTQVNTTWLLTGDVRFINAGLMSGTCLCWLLPEHQHFVHFGITEPGSTYEYDPGCLVHGPALEQECRWYAGLHPVTVNRAFAQLSGARP